MTVYLMARYCRYIYTISNTVIGYRSIYQSLQAREREQTLSGGQNVLNPVAERSAKLTDRFERLSLFSRKVVEKV